MRRAPLTFFLPFSLKRGKSLPSEDFIGGLSQVRALRTKRRPWP